MTVMLNDQLIIKTNYIRLWHHTGHSCVAQPTPKTSTSSRQLIDAWHT